MRKSALLKDSVREISKSFSRFFSIVLIMFMGVGFFVGVKATAPSMRNTADRYFDETNLMDLMIVAPIGFSEDDVEAIREIEGVRDIMPAYSADLLVYMEGSDNCVVKVMSLPSEDSQYAHINNPVLLEGRMPKAPGECVVSLPGFLDVASCRPGDVISFVDAAGASSANVLNSDSYEVVGIVRSAQFISYNYGSTFVGDGSIRFFMMVFETEFIYPRYTEVYAKADGTAGLSAFDPDYANIIRDISARIEEIGDSRFELFYEQLENAPDKLEDLVVLPSDDTGKGDIIDAINQLDDAKSSISQATIDISNGWKEYRDSLAKTEEDFQKAWDEINKGMESVAENESLLMESERLYEDGRRSANQRLAQARRELDSAWSEYRTYEREYNDGVTKYQKGLADYEKGWSDYSAAEAEYNRGVAEYEAETAPLRAAESDIREGEEQINIARARIASGERDLAMLRMARDLLVSEDDPSSDGSILAELDAQIAEGEAALALGREQLAQGEAELNLAWEAYLEGLALAEEGKAKLDAGAEKLAAAREELADSKKLLDDSKAQLDDAKKQLDDSLREINSGEAEYEAGVASSNQELLSVRRELDSGWAQLSAVKGELSGFITEVTEQETDANKQLGEAYQELLNSESELDKARNQYDEGMNEYNRSIKSLFDTGKSYYALKRADALENYSGFDSDAQRINAIADIFPVFFLLVAALVCLTTMSRMIDEQRTQMGTYKALGYSNISIVSKYASYALFAGIIGAALGQLVCVRFLPKVIFAAYSSLYRIPPLEITMPWDMAIISMVVGLACTVLVAIICCYKELKYVSATLMRPKPPKSGNIIFLERIPALWKRLSFSVKIAARNILRHKVRLLMTVVGVAGCMALIVAGFGLRNAVSPIVERQYGQIHTYDVIYSLSANLTGKEADDFRERLLTDKEIADVLFTRQMPVNAESAKTSESISEILIFVPKGSVIPETMVTLTDSNTGKTQMLVEDGVLITAKLAEKLDVSVGGDMVFTMNNRDYTVKVSGIVDNYIMHYIYMSESLYNEVFERDVLYNSAVSVLSDDVVDIPSYKTKWLQEETDIMSILFVGEFSQSAADMIQSLKFVVLVMILCAGALAFVVVYNLTNINISERIRELATIKVLGFRYGEVSMYVFRENFVMAILGILFGSALGYLLAQFMISTVEVDMVMFIRQLLPKDYLYATLLTVLFTVLANVVMTKRIRNIDMVESLKAIE